MEEKIGIEEENKGAMPRLGEPAPVFEAVTTQRVIRRDWYFFQTRMQFFTTVKDRLQLTAKRGVRGKISKGKGREDG